MTTVEAPSNARVTATRLEKIMVARRLAAEGLTQAEVARRMGISRSYAGSLLSDPDDSKRLARRTGYAGTCLDCGTPTKSNGTSVPSPRCPRCAQRKWTPELIAEAIQRWDEQHGHPPSARDWRDGHNPGYPTLHTVQRLFGSWANGIEAAGFPRPARGVRRT